MYISEQELLDAVFSQTPEVFHSGKGNGKIYAKSVENVAPFDEKNTEGGKHYESYSVDPDGVVAEFHGPSAETEVKADVAVGPKAEEAKTEE